MRRRKFYRRLIMYKRLLSKARHILTRKIRNRIRLNNRFNEIVNQFSIDYSNAEFQDIQSAVLEYLNRLTTKINERGIFKIIRIQPVGSMAERTAMWKMNNNGKPYTEFDFLAVLQAPDTFCPVDSCKGCMKVSGCQFLNEDLLQKNGYSHNKLKMIGFESYRGNCYSTIGECFNEELRSAAELSCDCYSGVEEDEDVSWDDHLLSWTAPGCNKCTVRKTTGQLRTNRATGILLVLRKWQSSDRSIALTWTSTAKILLFPVTKERTSKKTWRPQHLEIKVDFLPALELFADDQKLEHKCFLVSKSCPYEHSSDWRISHCIAEINHFRAKITSEHTKCYKVLKHLFQLDKIERFSELSPYHIKTAVLNHSNNCSHSSQSCADCVFSILRELEDALRLHVLTVFNGKANLFKEVLKHFANPTAKCIGHLLNLLSKVKSRRILELDFYKQVKKLDDQCEQAITEAVNAAVAKENAKKNLSLLPNVES